MLFYQDFKDTFVCNTQPVSISSHDTPVVLSGFQRYFCMQYTTSVSSTTHISLLFYQDFKDTFVCNTQHISSMRHTTACCFIRISKILLYAIHNKDAFTTSLDNVVLSGFQRYFCMQYTTMRTFEIIALPLFYQDFKDTFVCNTQQRSSPRRTTTRCFIRISKILLYAIHNICKIRLLKHKVVLSGFQRYFCMQYTTFEYVKISDNMLFYQDFKDTFVCNTRHYNTSTERRNSCFIRISKILLYAIHNYKIFSK